MLGWLTDSFGMGYSQVFGPGSPGRTWECVSCEHTADAAMAYQCSAIRQLLVDHDIFGAVDSQWNADYGNLLIMPLKRVLTDDSLVLLCNQFAPEGLGLEAFGGEHMHIPGDSVLQTQTIQWSSSAPVPEIGKMYWLKHVEQIDTQTNFIFHGFSTCLALHTDMPVHREIHILELYAGGVGGWQSALHFLQQEDEDISVSSVAVEHELNLAVAYALSHQANLIHQRTPVPEKLLSTSNKWIICDDASSELWLRQSQTGPWTFARSVPRALLGPQPHMRQVWNQNWANC